MICMLMTMFTCTLCSGTFTRKDNLLRHMRGSCPYRLYQTSGTASNVVTNCPDQGTRTDQPSTSGTAIGECLSHNSLLSIIADNKHLQVPIVHQK